MDWTKCSDEWHLKYKEYLGKGLFTFVGNKSFISISDCDVQEDVTPHWNS
jgi:hypothetical protein